MQKILKHRKKFKFAAFAALATLVFASLYFTNTFNVKAQSENLIKKLALGSNESGEVICDGEVKFSLDEANPGKLTVVCVANGEVLGESDAPSGLTAKYYNNKNFTDLMVARIDYQVDFDWGWGKPVDKVSDNTFSVEWSGKIVIPTDSEYTFYMYSDDGVRLYINNKKLIENWTDHSSREDSGKITLAAGEYPIYIQYYENTGLAVSRLSWSSNSISKQIVPSSNLIPDAEIPSPAPSASPTSSPTQIPAPSINPSNTPVPSHAPQGNHENEHQQVQGDIFGVVPDDVLGTCSKEVHDKYVVIASNGKKYRTWHPVVDADTGCRFAHEHGDNPTLSNIYSGTPITFGLVGSYVNMDMPHVGYKCFVHNKGTRNDEGRIMQHDSYYCFHMGTAGAARFTAEFHELYFNFRSNTGQIMRIQGLAGSGKEAGTICDNPRRGRTVLGIGCVVDSPYEIWANDLFIKNNGNILASAQVSTAVFDPITVMDPSDKSKSINISAPETSQIFKFNNDRSYYRGCNREAYTGPVSVYNSSGSNIYYTDLYGNVTEGGVLKQEVPASLSIVGIQMTENGQTQFKLRQDACTSGLGTKN